MTGAYMDPHAGPHQLPYGQANPDANYTGPRLGYNRDGLIYITNQIGQSDFPLVTPGPWHILRAQRPPSLMQHVYVRAARVDFLTQPATWYRHITMDMPNTFRTAAWQPDLQQLLDTGDGSFGVGAGITFPNGTIYLGYLPGVPVQIGLNEYATTVESEELGTLSYEHPVIIYEKPLAFEKFDILALQDGRATGLRSFSQVPEARYNFVHTPDVRVVGIGRYDL